MSYNFGEKQIKIFGNSFEQNYTEKYNNWTERFFRLLEIDNQILRFLIEYDFLVILLEDSFGKQLHQKDITEYIEKIYKNNGEKVDKFQTRRSGRKFYEDKFTFCRNKITHNNNLQKNESVYLTDVKKLLLALNNLIMFTIKNAYMSDCKKAK